MKKIAVFGKPGGGKSTLSKNLSLTSGLKLYALDSIQYHQNGDKLDSKIFLDTHNEILTSQSWIIEGFGTVESFNNLLDSADTLVYIDLPYYVHYWWVTKRFLKGIFKTPEGWPKGCSVLKGTIQSYKVLKICPQFWNNDFMNELEKKSANKNLYVIKSVMELNEFINTEISITKK